MLIQAAGFDTTSGTIRWLLIALAHHPEVAEKIRDETSPDLDEHGIPKPSCSLAAWKYTQMVAQARTEYEGA